MLLTKCLRCHVYYLFLLLAPPDIKNLLWLIVQVDPSLDHRVLSMAVPKVFTYYILHVCQNLCTVISKVVFLPNMYPLSDMVGATQRRSQGGGHGGGAPPD